MRIIIRTIYKVLILTAGIIILGICLPLVWIYLRVANFTDWIRLEWIKMDMTEKEVTKMQNKAAGDSRMS